MSREKRYQARAEKPLGNDFHQTISKQSSACWILIKHKKGFVVLCPIGEQQLLFHFFSCVSKRRLLSCHTCPVFSPRLCVQEKLSYFALTRNGGTTDDSRRHFGCYQLDHSNFLRRLATSGPHEFLSERRELFRPRNGQASDEVTRGRLVSLEGLPFAFRVKHSNMGRSITRIWSFRLHFRESQTSMVECIDSNEWMYWLSTLC